MGDPWKSITPEGVRAFTYGVGTTALLWLYTEGKLDIALSVLIMIGLSPIFSKAIFITTIIFINFFWILWAYSITS